MTTSNPIIQTHNHQIPNLSSCIYFQNHPKTIKDITFSCKIEENEIHCLLNQDYHPTTIFSKGKTSISCDCLADLIKEVPELQNKANLIKLVKIANFLYKGTQYEIIEDPEAYIEEYNKIIENENSIYELSPYALIRYGIFDVSEIQLPKIKDNQLIFYVSSKIPYIVKLNYPIGAHPQITYELLPYL